MSKVFEHYNGTVEVRLTRVVKQEQTISINLTYGDEFDDAVKMIAEVVESRVANGSIYEDDWELVEADPMYWEADYEEQEASCAPLRFLTMRELVQVGKKRTPQ